MGSEAPVLRADLDRPNLYGVVFVLALLAPFAAHACAPPSNLPPPPPDVRTLRPASDSSTPPKAPSTIIGLYERSCEGGSAVGCNNLGIVYLEGQHGAKPDRARAERLFERGCDLGAAVGCGNLGFLLRETNTVRAIGLLTRACDGAWLDGCYWLGDIYSQGDHEDLPQAFAVLERACKDGHQRSCASLGLLYQAGRGVTSDARKAAALFDGACSAKVDFACTLLGNLLLSDPKAPADAERARVAYEKGCTDSFPSGCYAFGAACASGKLGKDWLDRADALLRRACEHGVAEACAVLAKRMEDQSSAP